jgi:penicillin-binding protein 1C
VTGVRWRHVRRAVSVCAVLALLAAFALVTFHLAFPFPTETLQEATRGGSALILDREGSPLAWRVDSQDNWRLPVSVESVSPWLVVATVAAEDKRFFSHPGVDPAAVARALTQNISGGRRVSGASTITMQAVRLVHPRRRTYGAKAVEAFRALQLERLAGKEEILDLYLNLAPYGGNVVGAEAASRLYFGKGAADLALGEAALLAGVPQRPAAFNPRRHLAAALERREYVFQRMRELGVATPDDLTAARRQPITLAQRPPRPDAACLADWVIARQGRDCGTVQTTLDPGIQAAVVAVVQRHARQLSAQGIDGPAVIVVGVESSELVAMVGSADPGDVLNGQVNAATSLRQPGSLLKPFIYARAYDSGLLTPDSVVFDVPTSWPGYRPENMDRAFRGPMPARRALTESRNLPAVRLLQQISIEGAASDLAALGIALHAPPESYGLSLALGTAEVQLVDVAGAYSVLARLGVWRPLRVTTADPDSAGRRVYSPGAAYLALRSLGTVAPQEPLRTVWKTGTSWNQRDAWAVAVTPSHVVAVWCGRLSGEGHPALTAAATALPLALEIADLVPGGGDWGRPPSVRTRPVCALTGAPPGPHCPHVIEGEFLPGITSDLPCRVHRAGGLAGERRVVEVWPPDVAAWLAWRTAPAAEADRPRPGRSELAIMSPRAGAEYFLPRDGTAGDVLHMEARTPPGAEWVYWFVDGELVSRSAPDEAVRWPLRPGCHTVFASDGMHSAAPVAFAVIQAPRRAPL